MNRREFLKYCGRLSLLFTGSLLFSGRFAEAFMKIGEGRVNVLWLQGQACSGDSVSLVYGDSPGVPELVMNIINLRFHPVVSVAQGDLVMRIIEEELKDRDYILCFEGSVPYKMLGACKVGEFYLTDILKRAISSSVAVVAVGTCASYGGIPAANKETGAVSVVEFMKREGINKPFVRLPGCPTNSLRITGTVAYIVGFRKLPRLDKEGRVKLYYPDLIHNNCQRFQYFVQDKFLEDFNEKHKCLFKMGCRGPVTYADCPLRRYNRNTSWCVDANAPCIGCANPEFPYSPEQPIYTDPKSIKPKAKIIG